MTALVGAAPKASFTGSLRQLAAAQKSNVNAPGYSRWVNRPAGRVIASLGNVLGATPNQITTISALLSAAGLAIVPLVRPSLGSSLAVAVLLLLGYAFDSADGQLARLRGGGSLRGEWLDHVVDCAKIALLHVVVLIAWFRFYDLEHAATLLIPLGFAVVASVWFFTVILSDLLRRGRVDAPAAKARADGRQTAPVLRSLLALPADFGVLGLSFVLLSTHNAFVGVYSALLVLNALFLVAKLPGWFAEMAAIDAGSGR